MGSAQIALVYLWQRQHIHQRGQWLDELIILMAIVIFDRELMRSPGLVHALEGTYLAWVDFSGTGMEQKNLSLGFKKKLIL